MQWTRADNLANTRDTHDRVARTAAAFGAALYTYDYSALQAAEARVMQLGTAAYDQGYAAAASGPSQAQIVTVKAKETASVVGVYVTDVVGGRAGAIVIVDAKLQSSAGSRNSVEYLQMSLLRQGSAWKVDAARQIATK